MIPWYSASAVNAPSTPPAAPSKCPVMLLVELTMSPFSGHEPVAVLVEWPRRLLRRVVALAERAGGGEPGDAEQRDGRLRAAGDHHVGVSVLDVPHRLADGMVAGRARRDGRVVHAGRAVPDGDLTADEVDD